ERVASGARRVRVAAARSALPPLTPTLSPLRGARGKKERGEGRAREKGKSEAKKGGLRERCDVEEAAQDVAGDAGAVVVVVVGTAARGPGDRAGGEHRAAVERLEEGHVGAHLGMLDAVGAGLGGDELLGRHGVDIAVLDRAGEDQSMGRSAQRRIGDVELEAGGPAQRAEIADPLLDADALEDESRAGVMALRRADEVGVHVEALRGEADADQALRRPAAAAPEAARLAGEAQMQLARMRLPGAGSGLAAADLDDARQLRVEGGAPVEAVAAHIDQTSALVEPVLNGVEHGAGMI